MGPIACGKSTLIEHARERFNYVVDQDPTLEDLVHAEGISLDFRQHNHSERQRVQELRQIATDTVWSNVPSWRRNAQNFVVETTGDKPELQRIPRKSPTWPIRWSLR